MAMESSSSPESRTYLIRSDDDGEWFAGCCQGGEQTLIGFYRFDVVGVFFDTSGRLLRFDRRPLRAASSEPERREDFDLLAAQQVLDAWKAEIGFVPGDVRILRFFLRELLIGIKDLPVFLQEFSDDPDSVKDKEERQEWHEDIRRWRAEGKFVLCWGKEYWMSRAGEVTDT